MTKTVLQSKIKGLMFKGGPVSDNPELWVRRSVAEALIGMAESTIRNHWLKQNNFSEHTLITAKIYQSDPETYVYLPSLIQLSRDHAAKYQKSDNSDADDIGGDSKKSLKEWQAELVAEQVWSLRIKNRSSLNMVIETDVVVDAFAEFVVMLYAILERIPHQFIRKYPNLKTEDGRDSSIEVYEFISQMMRDCAENVSNISVKDATIDRPFGKVREGDEASSEIIEVQAADNRE